MWSIIRERLRQGYRTTPFPVEQPNLPEEFRGLPIIGSQDCLENCQRCAEECPTEVIQIIKQNTDEANGPKQGIQIDLGNCLFCTICQDNCPVEKIKYSRNHSLAATSRNDLMVREKKYPKVKALQEQMRRVFGRSLKLRQVSAGGCNACEADLNVLTTVVFDLSRFGIEFVASPRHADGLIVTGPITRNMEFALMKTYQAVPAPKFVIAVGACAISGGPFYLSAEQNNGLDQFLPVDLYIPGCPPHPFTILDGILRWLEKIKASE